MPAISRHQLVAITLRMARSLWTRDLLLGQLQGESGRMRAEQVWILIEVHVRVEPPFSLFDSVANGF